MSANDVQNWHRPVVTPGTVHAGHPKHRPVLGDDRRQERQEPSGLVSRLSQSSSSASAGCPFAPAMVVAFIAPRRRACRRHAAPARLQQVPGGAGLVRAQRTTALKTRPNLPSLVMIAILSAGCLRRCKRSRTAVPRPGQVREKHVTSAAPLIRGGFRTPGGASDAPTSADPHWRCRPRETVHSRGRQAPGEARSDGQGDSGRPRDASACADICWPTLAMTGPVDPGSGFTPEADAPAAPASNSNSSRAARAAAARTAAIVRAPREKRLAGGGPGSQRHGRIILQAVRSLVPPRERSSARRAPR